MTKRSRIVWIALVLCVICGCNPLTTHKITSTIFDGVPSMPPPEEFCREYHETKLAEERTAAKTQKKNEPAVEQSSIHAPYAEKQCDDCHDKSKESGLVLPRQQLCFTCHPDLIKGSFIHGPVATGACLTCHDPHSSRATSLLKVEKILVCGTCHKEKRLAESMHNAVAAKGILCTDCHNPHAADSRFFLK